MTAIIFPISQYPQQGQQLPPPLMHQHSNQQQQSNQPNQLMANLAALAGVMSPQGNPMWAPGPFQDNSGKSCKVLKVAFSRKGLRGKVDEKSGKAAILKTLSKKSHLYCFIGLQMTKFKIK